MKSKKSFLRGGGGLVALAVLAVPIFALSASAGLQENGGFSVRAHSQHGEKTLEHTVSGFGSGGGSPVDPGGEDPGGEVDDSEFIVSAKAGWRRTLALAKDGSVYGFGQNGAGELGLGHVSKIYVPTKIPTLKDIKSIHSGSGISAAIDKDGDVYMWGSSKGVYLDNAGESHTPTKIEGLSNIKEVSLGINHGFAIDETGHLWSFGKNYWGKLGLGTKSAEFDDSSTPPTRVETLSGVKQAMADRESGIVLLNDGSVYIFGDNREGLLGAGSEDNIVTPYKIMDSDKKIVSISRSEADFFMVDKDGQVYVMGANRQGELGLGHRNSVTEPTLLTSLPPVAKTFSGSSNTLALTKNGEIYGFGIRNASWINNYDGPQDAVTPMKLDYVDGKEILDISLGADHTVFLMKNGKISGLGASNQGQLKPYDYTNDYLEFTEIKLK